MNNRTGISVISCIIGHGLEGELGHRTQGFALISASSAALRSGSSPLISGSVFAASCNTTVSISKVYAHNPELPGPRHTTNSSRSLTALFRSSCPLPIILWDSSNIFLCVPLDHLRYSVARRRGPCSADVSQLHSVQTYQARTAFLISHSSALLPINLSSLTCRSSAS